MSQRQLAAIMFTDFVGYSALVQRNEALALELLEKHWELLRAIFVKFDGHEIKTIGDAFLIEFPSALRAVEAGIAMQEKLASYNQSVNNDSQILIRIGIHMGDVERREDDVFGDGVNIASRIEPLAPSGGICISEPVYASVHNKISTSFYQMGEQKLKNISQSVVVYSTQQTGKRLVQKLNQRSLLLVTCLVIAVLIFIYADKFLSKPDKARVVGANANQLVMAVLPFRNLGSDDENTYLGKVIAEDLLSGIATIEDVRVKATFSSFSLANASPEEFKQQLGVNRLIDGTYRMIESSIRINIRMIDTNSSDVIWSNVVTDSLGNIFKLQEDMANALATELGLQYPVSSQHADRKVDSDAYRLYLEARQGMIDPWKDTEKTVERIMQVLEIEPDFPEAIAMLGFLNTGRAWITEDRESPFLRTGEEYTLRALEHDPDLAEAWAVLALNYALQYRWVEARKTADKAVAIRGGKPLNVIYTFAYNNLGHKDISLKILERIFEQDPLNPEILANLVYEYAQYGEDDKALHLEQLARERKIPFQEDVMAIVYARKGDMEKASRLMEQWADVHGLPRELAPNIINAQLTGRDETYENVTTAALESGQLPLGQAIFNYIVAGADEEKVFTAAEQALESGKLNQIAFFIPSAGRYRRDPRFLDIMEQLKLADYWRNFNLPKFCSLADQRLVCM